MIALPHAITFIRIFISPIFLLVYLEPTWFGLTAHSLPYFLCFLLSVSEVSDLVDGYIARKYNMVSDLGKILDPMADSIARTSVFLTFTLPPVNLPMLLIFVFIYRDSVVSTLRTICALKGFALAARMSGKRKAIIQAVAAFIVLFLMMAHAGGVISANELNYGSTFVVAMAAIYTVYSAADYILSNGQYVKKLLLRAQPSVT